MEVPAYTYSKMGVWARTQRCSLGYWDVLPHWTSAAQQQQKNNPVQTEKLKAKESNNAMFGPNFTLCSKKRSKNFNAHDSSNTI